ncbi:MAG: Asp23/Gls24 family envelope stress response protein [Candidatus Omnitrophota bacterium]|nr:Asp23/Gls24 family envelope stress response protein [Candidatus Omnitrophota bacterium]
MKEERTEFGLVRIHQEVIASVASIAISEIQGVSPIKNAFKNNLLEAIGRKYYPGINVKIDKNNDIRLEVRINIKYGYNIPEVASKVQDNIRLALEKMSDLSLKEINVNVQGVERSNEASTYGTK